MKEDFDDADAVERLRFDVFDVIDGGGKHTFVLIDDAVAHVLGRKTGVVPKNADDGNVNVREDVGGRAQNRNGPKNEQKNGSDDERIRPA